MKKPISQLIADFKKDCLELGLETEIAFKSVSETNREEQLILSGMPNTGRCETAESFDIPPFKLQNELLQQSVSLASAKPHSDHQSEAVKYLNANIAKYEFVRIKPFIDGSVFVETIENQSKLINNQK